MRSPRELLQMHSLLPLELARETGNLELGHKEKPTFGSLGPSPVPVGALQPGGLQPHPQHHIRMVAPARKTSLESNQHKTKPETLLVPDTCQSHEEPRGFIPLSSNPAAFSSSAQRLEGSTLRRQPQKSLFRPKPSLSSGEREAGDKAIASFRPCLLPSLYSWYDSNLLSDCGSFEARLMHAEPGQASSSPSPHTNWNPHIAACLWVSFRLLQTQLEVGCLQSEPKLW